MLSSETANPSMPDTTQLPALARVPTPRAKRRAEARARPGHERVAVDAMCSEHDMPDAPPASFPIHNVKQRSFFAPGSFCVRVLLPLLTFVAADPRARGLAERRETSSLVGVAQVTRDATLARRGPSRATGRPASRRSAVALSAQDRLPARVMMAGPTRRLRAPLALRPGCGAGLFVSAVTIRGRRHIPLRLQDRF